MCQSCLATPLTLMSLHREVWMTRISIAWTRLRIQIRDLRPQLRLCLRVTVATLKHTIKSRIDRACMSDRRTHNHDNRGERRYPEARVYRSEQSERRDELQEAWTF